MVQPPTGSGLTSREALIIVATIGSVLVGWVTLGSKVSAWLRPVKKESIYGLLRQELELTADLVIEALSKHQQKWRAANDAMYEPWRKEQMATDAMAKENNRLIRDHITEFAEFRRALAGLPQAFEHIARTHESVELAMEKLTSRLNKHDTDIALLDERTRQRSGMDRRIE